MFLEVSLRLNAQLQNSFFLRFHDPEKEKGKKKTAHEVVDKLGIEFIL